ncbi:MAG: hypothetical protein ACK4GR_01000 [bacterium]
MKISMKVSTTPKTIQDTFKIDFSKIDNSLEHSLLPFNDAYIMSKVNEKIKQQGYAKITGTFANLPIKLLIKPISSTTFVVTGKIGENQIKANIFTMETNNHPDLKKQFFLKNILDKGYINSVYNETHDQWGFQNLSSVLMPISNKKKRTNKKVSNNDLYAGQLTLTYNPETNESLYKVKQNCTCTKELVRATFISFSSKYPEEKVETKLSVDVTTDLQVEGKIKQNDQEWIINYKIE